MHRHSAQPSAVGRTFAAGLGSGPTKGVRQPPVSRFSKMIIFFAVIIVIGLVAELWMGSVAGTARFIVERELSAATGLSAKIRGNFDLDILPKLRIEATGLALTAEGAPGPLLLIEAVELHLDPWLLLVGTVAIDELNVNGAQLDLRSSDTPPAIDVESLVAAPKDDKDVEIDFRFERVEMSGLRVDYGEAVGPLTRVLMIDALTLFADTPESAISLALDGSFEGSPFTVRGEVGAAMELLRSKTPYPISLTGRLPEGGVEFEVTGHVALPPRLSGIEATMSIVVPDLSAFVPASWLTAESGTKFPLESIRITGELRDNEGALGAQDLLIETLEESPIRVSATGSIKDLQAMSGVEVAMRLEAESLDILQGLVEVSLPQLDAVEVQADFSDSDGSLGVDGTLRASNEGDALVMEFSGSDGNLQSLEELDVAFEIRARDLGFVGVSLDWERSLRSVGPVTARGRLRGGVDAVGVEGLSLLVGESAATWLKLEGSIKNLAQLAGVRLVSEFGIEDLRDLQSLVERTLPDAGPFRGGGILSDREGPLGIEQLTVTGGRPGSFEVDFEGAIDDLRNFDEIKVDATLEAASLGTLGALIGSEWPEIGPVSFEGHFTGSDGKTSMVGKFRSLEGELNGTASVAFVAGTRPNLHARITSRHIGFSRVKPSANPQLPSGTGAADASQDSWSSRDDALPVELLRAIDADIQLTVDHVAIDDDLDFHDLSLILKLKGGHLVVHEAAFGSKGGSLRAEMQVDASEQVPVVTLSIEVGEADVDFWMTRLGSETESTGIVDVSAALESHGRSAAELRTNLGGALSAVARDGTLASDYGQAFVMNVLRISLPALLSSGTGTKTGFGCVVIEFEVAKGIATAKTLALESENVLVVGRGHVDLGAGAFDLVLSPQARKPEVLNVSADVDVTGPLAKPVFRARRLSIPGRVVRGLFKNVLAPVDKAFRPLRGEVKQLCQEGLAPPTRPTN
jgi:uncharacterized protein involved in outer membrane biogenesis